ncbi:MAG TPA: tannase/feruloyl esterase family alpha/beta hydrolase [Burkholderiales bacterium]|nr:tannase/feruloyl esterase family alpha/beta hydrolase [Burkholderiales bacterium]
MKTRSGMALGFALLAAACASPQIRVEPAEGCAGVVGEVPASAIGIPSGKATVLSAVLVPASPLAMPPSAPLQPALPQHCRVLGEIAPIDPKAPPIRFQLNLPTEWNGRAVQYGGGGYNGVLITGTALAPAGPPDRPAPLARGYVTYGTDSGHQNSPGVRLQAFTLNDEALVNFAHASQKKVRDVAVTLIERRYGKKPERLYYIGSSQGGREGLTMAQRYPADFDGVFSRVPVISFVGLQHADTRNGLALMGAGWIGPAQVRLVHDAVLAACDAADGIADGLVADYAGCARRFDVTKLRCSGSMSPDQCLSDAQVKAVQLLHSSYTFGFDLANGVRSYPGRLYGGEATPGNFPVGGYRAWFSGDSPPVLPPAPDNGRAWQYSGGGVQYLYARDPNYDLRAYDANKFRARVQQMSALLDSTNPDLAEFRSRGGKLIVLEHTGDYAQSAQAGFQYYQSVVEKMGQAPVNDFMRLYVAPGVDHVGTGAPANVDLLGVLAAWVERGEMPEDLEVAQHDRAPPFAVTRSLPLCRWPSYPHYVGGDRNRAAGFECRKTAD